MCGWIGSSNPILEFLFCFVFMESRRRSISSEQKESDCIWDCGSPLYDSYELASFGHVLERHTMALPYPDCRSSMAMMRFRIISNKPKPKEGFKGKMANLDGAGLLRKVVRWALWKMKIRSRNRNNKIML